MRETILKAIDAKGRGLEIGPLNNPLLAKGEARVEYVDRAPAAVLREWYSNVDANGILEPDHIWGEQTLVECVGARVDFVVASHVIEHVPDLLGWLLEIADTLVDGGVAAFIVPDKRLTFDAARRNSTAAEMVDAYVRRLRRPCPRQVFDCFSNHRDLDAPCEPDDAALSRLVETCRSAEAGDYIDAHCWTFTPRGLLDLLAFAGRIGLAPFEVAAIEAPRLGRMDFLVVLRRLPAALPAPERQARLAGSIATFDLPAEQDDHAPVELSVLRAQAASLGTRLAAFESTTSWRITAPLRAGATVARRLVRAIRS